MTDQNIRPITVSTTEAARLLGISKPSVYRLIHRGDFPVLHVGNRTLVSLAGLDEWVKNQTQIGGDSENA